MLRVSERRVNAYGLAGCLWLVYCLNYAQKSFPFDPGAFLLAIDLCYPTEPEAYINGLRSGQKTLSDFSAQ